MKDNLLAILTNVEKAETDYINKAEKKDLHNISQTNNIALVPGSEMIKTYDNRMATKNQPGRPIYDKIMLLPKNEVCPLCGHRNVSTLDHILPKTLYTILAVTPVNLVACCADCNKLKSNTTPVNASQTLLHPYFDLVTNYQWLTAKVIESSPAALVFFVQNVKDWDDTLNNRVAHHFKFFDLANLYSKQAAREIADIRYNLQMHFNSGGANAVRTELKLQKESRSANQMNSWQAATYGALSESDWFCHVGFSLT